jgi:hypothetical protein
MLTGQDLAHRTASKKTHMRDEISHRFAGEGADTASQGTGGQKEVAAVKVKGSRVRPSHL